MSDSKGTWTPGDASSCHCAPDEFRTQFFLYEIAARVVAAYLGFDCGRKLLSGLRARKVEAHNSDFLDGWSARVIPRDAEPVQFWIQMGILFFGLLACLVVAIFGWWRPDS